MGEVVEWKVMGFAYIEFTKDGDFRESCYRMRYLFAIQNVRYSSAKQQFQEFEHMNLAE